MFIDALAALISVINKLEIERHFESRACLCNLTCCANRKFKEVYKVQSFFMALLFAFATVCPCRPTINNYVIAKYYLDLFFALLL